MNEDLCRCGHAKERHYTYCNNGNDTTRCRGCDPWVKANIQGGGVFVITTGSEFYQRDRAADHPFVASSAREN